MAQILLASNEDNWEALAEMEDFGDPLFMHVSAVVLSKQRQMEYGFVSYLLLDVIEGIWGVNGETDQDNMRIWV